MNVVIYARFSSHNQNEQSIEGQLQVCYAYAKQNNYTIINEYIDRALTGTNDNRPSFRKMIEDSNKKEFQGVLVYQLDRFSRSRYDSATYKAKLKKNGVRVFSARENISEDASGILIESVLEGMAEYYSAELSQKVRRGMEISASKCQYTGGGVALGYTIDKDKHFVINEEAAPIVRDIFEKYANGITVAEINSDLNAKQIKTAKGRPFLKTSLRELLKNKKYIGCYTFSDIIIENGIPRIVSDDLFYKVQERLRINKLAPARTKAKEEYILSTKLFCGHCKALMTGMCGTSWNKRIYRYYVCNNTRVKACDMKRISKNFIEDIIVSAARECLTDENIKEILNAMSGLLEKEVNDSSLNRFEKELKSIENKKINLLESLKICDIDSVKRSIFEEIEKMENEKKEINKIISVEMLKNNQTSTRDIKFFLDMLQRGIGDDIKNRKLIVTVFINSIYLYDDKVTIVFNTANGPVAIDKELIYKIEKDSSFCLESNGQPKKRRKVFFLMNNKSKPPPCFAKRNASIACIRVTPCSRAKRMPRMKTS